MKNICLILIAFLIIPNVLYTQDSQIQLRISADRKIYTIDDKIILDFTIQNISDKNLKITLAENINYNFGIYFSYSTDTECPQAFFQTEEPVTTTISLSPGETLTHRITGAVVKEKGYIGGKNNFENVYGIFIRFPDIFDSYLLDDYGKYFIQGSFYEFKLENINQQLLSNKIEIEIIENN